jgi:Zn-dependent oligopeptidase
MSTNNCEEDFKEAPSQFFEHWCCSPTMLKRISPTIPDYAIALILRRYKAMEGYTKGWDLVRCKMDMALHSKEFKGYSYAVAYNICDDILGGGLSENNLYVECQKLFFGYDVGQYRYMYSLSIALELLSVFEGRELDPVLGKRFRDEILSQGALRPSLESVVKFLGREPDMTAFLKIVQ